MSTDAVAIIGFVALFVLMLLRVPVGMAMGLVGVSGFAYLTSGGPALAICAFSALGTPSTISPFRCTTPRSTAPYTG